MFPPDYEPAPPSVVSVAPSLGTYIGAEEEPDPDLDEGFPAFHAAAADGGPDLSHHDAATAAALRAAVTGDVEHGRRVTRDEYLLVLQEFQRLQLPSWTNAYGPNDEISWRLPVNLNPGHVVWGRAQSDDLGALVRGCSCQFKKFGQPGKQFNVRGPKHAPLAAAEEVLRMAWSQSLIRVQGGEWVSRRGDPANARPAARFASAVQQGAPPSRRMLQQQRDEALEAAAAARRATSAQSSGSAPSSPSPTAAAGGFPAGLHRSHRMVSINQGYIKTTAKLERVRKVRKRLEKG